MPSLFLSYRRDDSAGHTGRLADALNERFGADRVFRDIEGIEPGDDFVEAVRQAISRCDVVLVVIGRDWLSTRDAAGRRRIDDPADHVRQEIAAALARDIRIIPLLVENATMPRETDLPPDITALARRNALPLSDIAWDTDVARLAATLTRSAGGATAQPAARRPTTASNSRRGRRLVPRLLLAAAVVAIILSIALLLRDRPDGATVGDGSEDSTAVMAQDVPAPSLSRELRMPGPLEAQLGLAIIGLQSLRVDTYEDGDRLVAGFRLQNNAAVELQFLGREFQLDLGNTTSDPIGDVDRQVAAGESADASIAFMIEPGTTAAILRFRHAAQVVEIPIDLRPDRAATPAPAVPATVVLATDTSAALDLGGVYVTVAGVSVRRFLNRDVVTARLRVRNPGSSVQRFSSDDVLLAVDGDVNRPYPRFDVLLPGDATVTDSARFEIPAGGLDAELRFSIAEREVAVPLDLRPAAR